MKRRRSSETIGVFYNSGEYVGFWRRLAIDVIDLTVVAIATFATMAALGLRESAWARDGVLLVFGLGYFVLVKSHTRTIGYRLCRAQLVRLTGEPPTVWCLLFRFMFWFAGPVNPLLDLMCIPSDAAKQSLRDKLTRTYVVNVHARPAGSGRLVRVLHFWMTQVWVFIEVDHRDSPMPQS